MTLRKLNDTTTHELNDSIYNYVAVGHHNIIYQNMESGLGQTNKYQTVIIKESTVFVCWRLHKWSVSVTKAMKIELFLPNIILLTVLQCLARTKSLEES